MKKIIVVVATALILIPFLSKKAVADVVVFERSVKAKEDYRELVLKAYLAKQKSPLAKYAKDFIQAADANKLDWRLIPAITGVESSFGKRIPANSFNAYGWANGEYAFNSWEESIDIVSDAIKNKYIDKGAVSIGQIARRYAPPSSTWAYKVKFFMLRIDPLPLTFTL